MPYISVNRLIDALLPSSDNGEEVAFTELKEAIPSLKEVTNNLSKGSVSDPSPADREIIANFVAAINSVETDGGRLSVEEVTGLSSYYFSPEFFDAAAIEASRRGITNLFSPDAKELLSKSTKEVLADKSADLRWFDLYLKLNECGLLTSFENAKSMIGSFAWNDRFLDDKGFWSFLKDCLVLNYVKDGIVSPDIMEISCKGLSEKFWSDGVPIQLYNSFKTQLMNQEFIFFTKAIEKNYNGIRVIRDADYFIELYKDENKRTAVLNFLKYAGELSSQIPFSGPLEPEDLEYIMDILDDVDIKKFGSTIKKIGDIFGMTEPITLHAIRLLAGLNEDVKLGDHAFLSKINKYYDLLSAHKTKPGNWLKIYHFIETVSLLPDDDSLLSRSFERLAQFNSTIIFPLDKDGFNNCLNALKESESILEFAAKSPNLSLLLKKHDELFPEKPLIFTLNDLSELSAIDEVSEKKDIDEILKCIELGDHLINSLDDERFWGGRHGKGFADIISFITKHPEERQAAIALIEEFPVLTEQNTLGERGIKMAPQLLEWMMADREYYDILVKDLGVTDIYWSSINEKSRIPSQFPKIKDTAFLDSAKKILGILDAAATEEQKRYLHSPASIGMLYSIYNFRPDLFQKIISLPEEQLKDYLLLAGDVSLLTKRQELEGWPNDFVLTDMWSFMAFFADRGVLDAIPEFIKLYPSFKYDQKTLLAIAGVATSDPEALRVLITPEFLEWFKASGLPSTKDTSLSDIPSLIEILPKIYNKRDALMALQDLPRSLFDTAKKRILLSDSPIKILTSIFGEAPALSRLKNVQIPLEWPELTKIFRSSTLIDALKNPAFAPYWIDVMGASPDGNIIPLKDIIEVAKVFAVGVPPEVIKIASHIGYDTINQTAALITLKDKKALLEDPKFVNFVHAVTKEYCGGSYNIYDLYPLTDLYLELKKKGLTGEFLKEKRFTEFNSSVQFIIGSPPNGTTLLTTFRFLMMGVELKDLRELKKEIERPVNANDLYMLAIIANDDGLKKLYHDRPRLEREISKCLKEKDAIFRSRLDIGYNDPDYTERPDLKNADMLFLIRAYLILNTLKDGTFIDKTAEFVRADLADKRTEFLFGIDYNQQEKKIELVKVESISFEDGAASHATDTSFQNHVSTAHLHAVAGLDESGHAGPSGYYDAPSLGGDLGVALDTGMPDLVISPCGFDNEGRLVINFDLYYATKSSREYGNSIFSTDATSFILDLGAYSTTKPISQ